MPYVIRREGREFCVHVQAEDGSAAERVPGSCHPTEAEANRHMAALYANVPDARTGALDCGCHHGNEPIIAAATGPLDDRFPVPAYPPAEWLTERPDWLTPDTKIAVDDAGRVAGYFYNTGQCLVHDQSACPQPSPTGYAAFHQQEVVLDDGSVARVGVIGNTNGHASPFARVDVAQAHYADPDRQLIVCRAYDDEHGGYILGAMVPHATYGDVALVRRSALSGDWRPMPAPWWTAHGVQASVVRQCEGYDCIGPTLVTRPGLPLVQRFTGRAAAMLGGVGGVQVEEEVPMGQTKVELPGGVTITTHDPNGMPAGPQPAVTAAQPPPPPGAEEAEPAEPSMEEVVGAINALDERLTALEQALGATAASLASLHSAYIASLEAQATALPEVDATP